MRARHGRPRQRLGYGQDDAERTVYEAKDGNRVMDFAFVRPDTVVLGSNEAFVTEAIGTGKKALDNAELKT